MFKRHRGWKRKPRRRRPWFLIVLLLIAAPIGLELLARLLANVTGVNDELAAEESPQVQKAEVYRLGFLSPSGQPYERLPQQGELRAVRSPLMGYQLLPQQQSSYWTINPQGFRDPEPVPLQKESNEVRIFVLGGSMAFGQLSSNDQSTLAGQLEALLNQRVKNQRDNPNQFQPAILPYTADEVAKVMTRPPRIPERQYRVVNAAVPGYASGNDLAQLMQQVSDYNPDMLLVLNSYEDLLMPSTQLAADIPGLDDLLQGQIQEEHRARDAVQGWFDRLYLVRGVRHYLLQTPQGKEQIMVPLNITTVAADQPLDAVLAADPEELERRVERYRSHLTQMVRWTAAARKRLLVGIQPEITTRQANVITPEEKAIVEELGDQYGERIQQGYAKILAAAQQATATSANAKLLDLHQLYATSSGQAFQSPTSLTDEAYGVLAEQYYQAIVQQLAIEPQPYGSN
ncbi:MAG: SGNH/GDSL hydrolase family protein [Synechococcales cyanobacterium M58_A2018_015]|nr:SGNH/GDSL hydrolase family protein [Synechococcales cyanobacterium M58_A2018_015]